MANVTWDAWYDDVIPYTNGCPPNIATLKIREAAIDFFRRSKAWRYLGLGAIDSVAKQQSYALDSTVAGGSVPAGAVVTHIYQVVYDGETLDVLTPEDFKALAPDCWFSDVGCPSAATQFMESQVSFYMIPESLIAGAIKLPDVALAPSQVSTGIDSLLYERWREAIALGARALIHQIPKKPYSDPQMGLFLEQKFNAAVGSAGARTASGRSSARLRTRVFPR